MTSASFAQEICIASLPHEGQRVQELILERLREHAFSDKVLFAIRLSLEEALINAIKHGNRLDPQKMVQIRYRIDHQSFHIEIEDEGPGFDPKSIPDPTLPENLERPSGRGLLLMRAYMTNCDWLDRGNICRMRRVKE
ncbi:ATP-binding protein [bacterium]|jgi:serine/threonine-protein kinase RsbW|nr:ATP-binding protein [bacterium]